MRDETLEHFAARKLAVVLGEIGPVAPVLRSAEEEHLDAAVPALAVQREEIGLRESRGIDPLARLHMAHRPQAVAVARRALEIERLRGGVHLLDQRILDRAALALEEGFGLVHQLAIALLVDAPRAGRRAALDLKEQARPRARGEHRIRARAQQERALQRVQRPRHRAGTCERSEIEPLGRMRAAMLQQLREGMVLPEQDVGKGFVVAIGNVVARLQPLDQVGFEQQRLDLRRRRDEQHLGRVGDHARDALGEPAGLRVGRNPLLQALGFADIKDVALLIEHAIDARRVGQRLQIGGNPRHALQRRVSSSLCIPDLAHDGDLYNVSSAAERWRVLPRAPCLGHTHLVTQLSPAPCGRGYRESTQT